MRSQTWSVYLIRCHTSGRCYVGRTEFPKQRWSCHKKNAITPSNRNYNLPMQTSIRENGADKFTFEVVATYEDPYGAYLHEDGLIKFHFLSGQSPFNSAHILGPCTKAKIAKIYGNQAVRKEYCTRVADRRDTIIKEWLDGKRVKEIAKIIGASGGTVRYHLRNWQHQQSQEAKV